MYSQFPDMNILIQSTGLAIIDSIWQCCVVYFILRLILLILPSNYSATRYNLSVAALFFQLGWFFFTISANYTAISLALSSYSVVDNGTNVIFTNNKNLYTTILSWVTAHAQLIVIVYTLGIIIFLSRIVYNIAKVKSLKRNNISEPPPEWLQLLTNLKSRLRVWQNVVLKVSEKVTVPMVMGTIKPIILIPTSLVSNLSAKDIEAILIHELAHVKRYDYLINIIQLFIETTLFYNPFVWLITSIIRKEREHCCDDLVLKHTEEKLVYAKALASLEQYRIQSAVPALGAASNKNQLLNRIKRIIEMKKSNINYTQLIVVLLIAIIALTSTIALTTNVYAQSKDDNKDGSTEKKKDNRKSELTLYESNGKDNSVSFTKKDGTSRTYKSYKDIPEEDLDELRDILKKNYDKVNVDRDGEIYTLYDREAELEKKAGLLGMDAAEAALDIASEAISAIDMEEIMNSATEGLNMGSIADSLRNIDWDDISAEMKKGMNEAKEEMKRAKMEVKQAAHSKADAIRALSKTTPNNTSPNRTKRQNDLAEASKDFSMAMKELANAQKELAQAQKELNHAMNGLYIPKVPGVYSSTELIDKLEQDGLINTKRRYVIEKKDNTLYINGEKQSDNVYNKYNALIETDYLKIKGNKNKLNISTE